MFARWITCLTLVGLVAAPAPVRAQAKKGWTPTVVVRVRSVDTVIDNLKLVVSLAGRENMAQQIEGLIKTKLGPNGLEGIDPKRPFGFYAKIGKEVEDVIGAVMIPIADEKAFLGLIENLNFKLTRGKNGIYTVATGTPIDVSFRFANKYAYATILNLEALEPANMLDPAEVFPAQQTAALSATVRLDEVPAAARLIASAKVEEELGKAQDKKEPGETEKQRAFRVAALKEIGQLVQSVLQDGAVLNAEADISRSKNELTASISLSAKANSKLAADIRELGNSKSLFAGLRTEDSAIRGLIHIIPPEAVRKAFLTVVEEGMAKGLERIQDEAKRKQAAAFLKALAPTLERGELDAAFNFSGPGEDKHYTLVAGLKLKDGDNLARTVRTLLTDLLKEVPAAEKANIKLDFDSVGATKIHRFDIQAKFDEVGRAIFGESPLYVALRDDAMFLALGTDGLASIKKAIGAGAATAAPVQVEVSLARLAPFLANTDEKREAARKLFVDGDQGTLRLSLEGGDSVRLRFASRLSALQFLSSLKPR
jgi:hypothetical protein